MPFLTPFLGEGSPTNIDYRKKGTLILTSLLEVESRLWPINCDTKPISKWNDPSGPGITTVSIFHNHLGKYHELFILEI